MARPRGDTFSNTPVLLVQPRSNMRTRAGIVIAGEIRGTWRSCSRRTAGWLPHVHLDTDDNDTVPDNWKLAGSAWLSLPVALLHFLDGRVHLDLEHIAFTGNHLIQHGIDEEADEEPGDQARYDDNGERPLRIRSDAGGKGGRQQSEASNQCRHHDGPEPKQGSFPCSLANAHSLLAQLVDVGNENDSRFHGNP